MSPWEIAGYVTGLISVWWLVREKIAAWPAGIFSAAAYGVFFLQGHLYANAALQVIYIGLYIYGWGIWRHGTEKTKAVRIGWMKPAACLAVLLAGIPATVGIAYYLKHFTAAPELPWWDAGTTAYSIIGQWMQARKYLENWPLWLLVNGVYVGLLIHLDYRLTASLYALFAVLSVAGWVQWRKLRAASVAAAVTLP